MPSLKRRLSRISDAAPLETTAAAEKADSRDRNTESSHSVPDKIYRQLDSERKEIRVLEVQPGIDDEPLVCELLIVSLLGNPKPQYETISYVWGDKTVRGAICLHGQQVDVPINSEAALRRVRYSNQTRTVWIDALCINQDDATERGHQVSFMQKIYGHGQRNLIWLGDETRHIASALKDIQRLVDNMKAETNDFRDAEKILFNKYGNRRWTRSPLTVQIQDWSALDEFYRNPWFSRLWVVQEAALSRSNLCYQGHHEFKLESILRAAVWLSYKAHSTALPKSIDTGAATKIAAFADKVCVPTARAKIGSLESLLHSLAPFNVSDPRDHIFGTLGLASMQSSEHELAASLIPDYRLPTAIVFRDTTRLIINKHGQLNVLYSVSNRIVGDIDEWPSWVPRWDQKDAVTDRGRLIYTNFDACNESEQRLPLRQVENSNVIVLSGMVVEAITEITHIISYPQRQISGSEEFLKGLLDSAHRLAFQGHIAKPDVELMKALASTLLGPSDIRTQRLSESECVEMYQAYRSYLILSTYPEGTEEFVKAQDLAERAIEFHLAMRRACGERRLFSTQSGRIGFGFPYAKVGDLVVILHGAAAPFLLRESRGHSKDATHELIGICYVHGIMDGEAAKAHKAAGKEDEWFHLR